MAHTTFRSLRVSISLTAEELELMFFVLSNERARILRDSPDALQDDLSYASRVQSLYDFILWERDSNISTGRPIRSLSEWAATRDIGINT